MKRIFTVQHTQSEHHVNGMVGSWTDWDLTETGKRQAELIAQSLARELKGKDVVLYSSDLKRAKQTSGPIAARLGVEPVLRPELRERNLGRCCGRSVQWLKENLERDEKTVDDRLFSDAESRRDVWNRLRCQSCRHPRLSSAPRGNEGPLRRQRGLTYKKNRASRSLCPSPSARTSPTDVRLH